MGAAVHDRRANSEVGPYNGADRFDRGEVETVHSQEWLCYCTRNDSFGFLAHMNTAERKNS